MKLFGGGFNPLNKKKDDIAEDQQQQGKILVKSYGFDNSKGKLGYSQDLLEFDNIEPCTEDYALLKVFDNEYVGMIEVMGVPFNLLSISERLSLEEGFGEMLNGVDSPFQIYVQSRRLDLDTYSERYESKVKEIRLNKEKIISEYEKETDEKVKELIKKKAIRVANQLDYATKLLSEFRTRNIDSGLLEKKYYIILKYIHNEDEFENLGEHDVLEHAFNDIYNKASLFIGTLAQNNLECIFLNANGIAELLYRANNKEDSSNLKIGDVLENKFGRLFTTAQPVEMKQINLAIDLKKKEQEELIRTLEEDRLLMQELINKTKEEIDTDGII